MPDFAIGLIVFTGFVLGFPLLWTGVVFLLSRVGGWARLAERFGADGPGEGQAFNWSTAYFRLTCSYRHCLTVTLSELGIHLVPIFVFRIGHKPLFIPWSAIAELQRRRILFYSSVKLNLKDPDAGGPASITFYGSRLCDGLERYYSVTHGR